MPARPILTRRTALTGIVTGVVTGLVTVSGCDLEEVLPPSDSGASGTPTPSPAPQDPDTALVETVLTAIGAAQATVEGAQAFPRLRADLAPLAAMHQAHAAVLAPEGHTSPSGADGAIRAPDAWALVRRAEADLRGQLADAAIAAQSGALARLLASMSAAVAQHLALLPARLPAGRAP